jgi:5-methylphenazine-1-carboxylate 1-monooxygenase
VSTSGRPAVVIAGAGIAGLTLGLTLDQLGIDFAIVESVRELRPLGVGINLQPHAVRELFDVGLEPGLERIGVRTRQYGFYTRFGLEIWVEPRGTWAGYRWPQYSVHRGRLQLLLHDTLVERAGTGCLRLGDPVVAYENAPGRAALLLASGDRVEGALAIGADGIHSAVRAHMHPAEGPPVWAGAILWRGTTVAPPFFGGGAMALAGNDRQRIVAYPISGADPESGLALVNWIAERRVDPAGGWRREDWNRRARVDEFLPLFTEWVFEWLDVPALVRDAEAVYEYPMVDRDPVGSWTQGRVTLIGDAAHPTYPVGSTGGSQAVVDARELGAAIVEHGLEEAALRAYEDRVRPAMERVILANRGAGPDAVMQMVEDRCGGRFDRIEDVIPRAELASHAERYKRLAGFSVEELNARPSLIGPVSQRSQNRSSMSPVSSSRRCTRSPVAE